MVCDGVANGHGRQADDDGCDGVAVRHAAGGHDVCGLRFVFCFEPCVSIPLHTARGAMAAALPLPSKEQRRHHFCKEIRPSRTSLSSHNGTSPIPRYGLVTSRGYKARCIPGAGTSFSGKETSTGFYSGGPS